MPGTVLCAKEIEMNQRPALKGLMICLMPPKLDWGLPGDEDSDLIPLWVPHHQAQTGS